MLGFLDHSLNDAHIGPPVQSHPRATAKRAIEPGQNLNALVEHEWAELPYTMMRLTPSRSRWDAKPFYWQDRTLQLGDIDLNLTKTRVNDSSPNYLATFRINEARRAVTPHPSPKARLTHREFTLHPVLQGGQLRWSSAGIGDSLKLNNDQLAESLLSKLATFYTRGLS